MLEKKIVTLTCAAGILACGACFLPPLPQRPPPPPPRQLDLQGIQSIRVVVTNNSELRHLDSGSLAEAVASVINWQTKETGVSAHVQQDAGEGDAVLAITVLSETATPATTPKNNGLAEWSFFIKTSSTLTKQNGQVVWHETEAGSPFSRALAQDNPENVWKDPELQSWLSFALSRRMVYRMFYVH